MTLLILDDFLALVRGFTEGTCSFDAIRDWVYEYFYAEHPSALDGPLDEVFVVLLPYLQWEEAEGDALREERFRRLLALLSLARDHYTERAVFAIAFDETQVLTRKLASGVIGEDTYWRKMSALSPAPYDVRLVAAWAAAHHDLAGPLHERLS